MDRAARVRAELERVKIEARAIEASGPPCRDCRYSTIAGACSNPAYYKQIFNPATGAYSIEHNAQVEFARSEQGLCGPEGLLWEPTSEARAALTAIGRHMEAHPWQTYFCVICLWALLDWLL
jgi:hypothetical protein